MVHQSITNQKGPENKMVKLKPDTVEMLKDLKVVPRESYDEVINRLLLQIIAEDQLELNAGTQKLILERINKLKEGKVKSSQQILELLKQKKEVMAKRGEINKHTPGRFVKDAKDTSTRD